MKIIRPTLILAMLLSLFGTGIVYADTPDPEGPVEPGVINSFTILPSTAIPEDTVHFSIDFATQSTSTVNTFCFYFIDSVFQPATVWLDNVPSGLGDTYTRMGPGSLGEGVSTCQPVPNYYIVVYENGSPSFLAQYGDILVFSIAIPHTALAGTKTFALLQRDNTGVIGSRTSSITIPNISNNTSVFIANDSGACGSNSPCIVGIHALDYVTDRMHTDGTITVIGNYIMDPADTASVGDGNPTNLSIAFPGGTSINNAAGTCANAMISAVSSGTLNISNGTINGACSSGSRTVGVLSNSTGTVGSGIDAYTIIVQGMTLRNFTANNASAVSVAAGTLVAQGNTFNNNYAAMSQSGGNLWAFANSVMTNIGPLAAIKTGSEGAFELDCNYWGSVGIDSGFANDYDTRLGSPVVTYAEGASPGLSGATVTTIPGSTAVIVDMGRSNPPFGVGTSIGLGAVVSDLFAVCDTRGSPDSSNPINSLTIPGDVSGDYTNYRLFTIAPPPDNCTPSTNALYWGQVSGTTGSKDKTLSNPPYNVPTHGHYVIGNGMDPTIIQLRSLSGTSARNTWIPLVLLVTALVLGSGSLILVRRIQR